MLRLQHLRFDFLHGVIGYDDGVYFGSALQLVEGNLPYRDYALVHPPVITLLLAPLALLGKVTGTAVAMALAKVLTGLAGTVSVPLAARLLWHRGPIPALAAAAVLAVHDDSVVSAYGVLLEPWVVLFCLLGAVLVFDGDRIASGRRLAWGAAVLGVACATKIWALVPVLVLLAVCLPDRRKLRRAAGGALAGFAVTAGPFAVLAPGAFVHQVFLDQLLRSSADRTSLTHRLLHLFGVSPPNAQLPGAQRGLLLAAALLAAALLAGAAVMLLRRGTPLERFAALAAFASVTMMLAPDTFYWHYAAFPAPFLALVAALLLGRLHGRARPVWAGVTGLAVAALAFTMVHRDARDYRVRDDTNALTRAVPAGACVVSSMITSTITADRYLAHDCPALVDSFGTALSYGDGATPSGASLRGGRLQALWLRAYRRADYVYLVRNTTPTVPTTGAPARYLAAHFHRVPGAAPGAVLYARNTARH